MDIAKKILGNGNFGGNGEMLKVVLTGKIGT